MNKICKETSNIIFGNLKGKHKNVCMRAKSLQSCLTLWDSMNCSPPGSYVHGIIQASFPFPSPADLPNQGLNPHLSWLLHWEAGSLPLAPPEKSKQKHNLSQVVLENTCFDMVLIFLFYCFLKWKIILNAKNSYIERVQAYLHPSFPPKYFLLCLVLQNSTSSLF